MRNRGGLLALACLGWGLVAMAARPCGAAVRKTYDASLGTLPDAQGFTLIDTGGSPPCTIQGDAMHQGLTCWEGLQNWYSDDVPLDFDVGAVMEADFKVMYSSYSTGSGYELTGLHLVISDAASRVFNIHIASDKIALGNQLPTAPDWRAFDATDGFHHYRLVVAGGVGSLFIDGGDDPFSSIPVGSGWYHTPNYVAFGDRTYWGQSEWLLRSLSYINVPEPVTLSLLAVGALGLLRRRKR